MLHGWIILFVQTFQVQTRNQNCGTWLARIKFADILKHVGCIVMKNASFIFKCIVQGAQPYQSNFPMIYQIH